MTGPRMGTLYIVSTPIGNLKDITYRAVEVLKSVDLIACEDTRRTSVLLSHYDIHRPTTSFYQHNRIQKSDYILRVLKEGKNVALVSDAGTPGVLDPGYSIINLAISNKITVTAIPGPTALIVALTVSGLPANKFVFEGFLSNKPTQRRKRLKELKKEGRTIIIYESPHRLVKMLQDLAEIFSDPEVICVRELTKKFEEIRREKTSRLIEHFTATKPKGEFILIFNPKAK